MTASPVPAPVDATVFVEVEPVGAEVTTVVVEYDRKLDLHDVQPEDFQVLATLTDDGSSSTGARTVTNVYSSSDAEPGAQPGKGRYLVIELDPADATARYVYASGTRAYELDGAYRITQVGAIEGKKNFTPAVGATVVNSSTRVLVVEDFVAGTFAASNGTSLDYRLFAPDVRPNAAYPLVLALHGVGGTGTENLAPLVNNELATAFADPERQATDPSFVLVPQRKPTQGLWSAPDMTAALLELVDWAKNALSVDASRVYLTGNSMGGNGSWALISASPDTFAAALIVCGWYPPFEPAVVASPSVPIWAHHSVDDPTVPFTDNGASHDIFVAVEAGGTPVTWGQWRGDLPVDQAAAQAATLWAASQAAGSEHLFTAYLAGTTPVSGHHSWIPTYSNPVLLDWIFSHRS